MRTLPDKLTRRGISAEFNEITAIAWEKLFEREDQNGIAKLRVQGDMQNRAYYSVEGIIQWLVRNDYYTRSAIDRKLGFTVQAINVRTHVLA